MRALWALLGCRGFGCPRWFAGLSAPPIHPSRGGFRGLWAARHRGSPPPATGNNQEQHSRAIGRRLDPGSSPAQGESRMRGGSCITCGHHPPGPRAAGSPGTGTLYQKPSKHRHINRVEVGVGEVVGKVNGEGGLKKKVYKAYPIAALSISNEG